MNGITNQIRIGEDTPLEPGQTGKVFVNTVYLNSKAIDRTPDLGKSSAMDVEINTKIPVEIHSKKFKCGLIVVITVSTLSAILSISLAYYHYVNSSLLQKQVDFLLMKMENITSKQHSISPSLAPGSPEAQMASLHGSIFYNRDLPIYQHAGVQTPPEPSKPVHNSALLSNDLFVTHFYGGGAMDMEFNMGMESTIGPWVRDTKVSSRNSQDMIELENKKVTIKEGGLYLIYAQVMYLSQEPCCYTIFANDASRRAPRTLAMCAAGGDASGPARARSQLSCAAHTVARLAAGDSVHLAQREHGRTIYLKPGYTYLGFVKIAS